MEDKDPSPATLATMASLAKSDPSPVVRLYLASALQRLPLEKRWDILAGLTQHAEDADDHNLPLMDWYAAEPLAEADPSRALSLATNAKITLLTSFMVRRVGAIGTPEALALLVEELGRSRTARVQQTILEGINTALKGRRQVAMPAAWPKVFEGLLHSDDARVRSQATALALTFGDPAALATMRRVATDAEAALPLRRDALTALLKVKAPELAPTLRSLLNDAEMRDQALRGLAAVRRSGYSVGDPQGLSRADPARET